jgi:hypothetical protein
MSEPLKFKSPVFQPGVNITVRDGAKWDMLVDQLPKDVVIENEAGEAIGRGKIIGKMVIPFQSIPEEILKLEHDQSAQNFEGLKAAMENAYGANWTPSGVVTVLFFVYRPTQ